MEVWVKRPGPEGKKMMDLPHGIYADTSESNDSIYVKRVNDVVTVIRADGSTFTEHANYFVASRFVPVQKLTAEV